MFVRRALMLCGCLGVLTGCFAPRYSQEELYRNFYATAPAPDADGKAVDGTGDDGDKDVGDLELRIGPEPIQVPAPYRLRAEDIIKVAVLGDEEATVETVPVGPDGRIQYQGFNVYAAGKTFAELAAELEEKLSAFYNAPRVSVSGSEFAGHSITLMGLIAKPGRYKITTDTRLLDAIALAGGIRLGNPFNISSDVVELADLDRAYVLRGKRFLDVDFNALFSNRARAVARNNILMEANDRVFVPSSASLDNKVIVLGAVARPQMIRFKKSITFAEAIASAGGTRIEAWERRSFIVRNSSDPDPQKRLILPVSARAVGTGRMPNVPLQSGDIVYVPLSPLGKLSDVAKQLNTAINSTSITNNLIRDWE